MKTFEMQTSESMNMVWAIREKINEETKDMTNEEFAAYIRKGSERAQEEIEKRRSSTNKKCEE